MKRILLPFLTVLFTVACAGSLFAQVTTATIAGSINDKDGSPLVGATIVATNTATGAQYGTTANADGRFTLPNLRVGGPYEVTASYVGYSDDVIKDIYLALGQTARLDFELAAGVGLDEVVVTGVADPNVNRDRTGVATLVGSTELTRLPTISRSTSDFTRLTPSSDGNSFAGRNDQFNNFSLDGSIFNNPFGLDAATPGGQTDAQPISLDAIDQIQVNIAPYDVTQAGFTGAAVNAVTKSGTNDFKGTVFGFYRNENMTGSKVAGNEIFVPELNQLQAGFSLGGPIIRNKLFFFANAEIENREDLGSNFLAARQGVSGSQVSRVEAADLELVSDALRNRFGYETGPYENFLFAQKNTKGIFKLDWNIGKNQTLTATYNFLDATKEKPAHPQALGRRGPDATTLQFRNSGYAINNVIHSAIVEHRTLFSDRMSNKLQAGFTSFNDSRDPLSTPFPSIIIQRDGINYIVAGHEPFSVNNRLDQKVYQVTNNLSLFLNKHTLTVGASMERFEFDNSFNLGFYAGAFGPLPGAAISPQAFVESVNAGELDQAVADARGTFNALNGEGSGYKNTGWSLAETNVGQFAFYLQDEIDLTDQFKLTVGLRMDMPLYFDTQEKIKENIARQCCYDPAIEYYNESGETVLFDHTVLPTNKPLISPRLGFNYDMTGDQSTILRGGTGLFTGRFPFVWFGNHVANPNFFFYTVTSPDFQFPQVWRSNLGIDKKANGWTVSADVVYTKDLNAMMVRNYGVRLPTGKLEGVDNREIYLPTDRALVFGGPTNAYVFTNTDEGYSFNASLQVRKDWSNGWFTSIGYNYLDAKDASSIEAEISSDAYDRNPSLGHVNAARLTPSLYGNRHRVVGSAHKRFEYGSNWATTVAAFFEYAQGGRFSYTYSGDINNDGSGQNDLLYIPTATEINQMAFSGDAAAQNAQRRALEAFIQQDEYLNDNRGGYAEKYDILSPWYSRWDVRLLQDYRLGNGNVVQLSLDMLNIGNFINSKWGVRQFPTNTQPLGVNVADGVPTYRFDTTLRNTFTNDFSLASRWQLQMGLRYSF